MCDEIKVNLLLRAGIFRFSVGFTLTEVMVVVVIVGILATIAIPTYNKMVEQARVSEAKAMIAAIVSAEKAYRRRNNGVFLQIDENVDDFVNKLRVDIYDSAYFDYKVKSDNTSIYFKVTATVNADGKLQGGLPEGGTVFYNYNRNNDPRGTWGGTLN